MDNITIEVSTQTQLRNFVEANRRKYFEDHSLNYCVEQILQRGMAEITRYIKTNENRKEQMASGALIKELGLTPAQAKEILAEALKQKKVAA